MSSFVDNLVNYLASKYTKPQNKGDRQSRTKIQPPFNNAMMEA